GSRVLLTRGGKTNALPGGYLPRPGDALIVAVPRAPEGLAESITIENRLDGDVTLTATGEAPRVVAKVRQPLKGIGRYSSTERSGSGSVLSWSPTTVLVSTSGVAHRPVMEGQVPEDRGGFVIQPAEPTLRGTTHPASQ